MSSPMSSLGRGKKPPLQGGRPGQRPVPFRHPEYTNDEESMFQEIFGDSPSSSIGNSPKTRSPFASVGASPRHSPKGGKNTPGPGPTDHELMSTMMKRIAQLESRVTHYSKEVIEKDKKIKVLEEKTKLLTKAKDASKDSPSRVQELERKCLLLQQQAYEMETFLADYGMVWVGEETRSDSSVYVELEGEVEEEDGEEEEEAGPEERIDQATVGTNTLWKPAASYRTGTSVVSSSDFKVDYNTLIENIKDLNVLAGEGEQKIVKTSEGATLQRADPIPLTLYANGIFMFNGPFRRMAEPSTQLFLQDIMDGYFPSELQTRFPDGVPFTVSDKRDTVFKDKRWQEEFPGSGHVLGGDTKPSRLLPSNLRGRKEDHSWGSNSELRETSEAPVPMMSVDQFLNKVPSSVIKGGRVIDIRASLGETLKGGNGDRSSVTVIDTPVAKGMKERLEKSEAERPPSARDITTLRVKAGEQNFILKMRFSDSIGDVRRQLEHYRPAGSGDYELLTTFPNKVYRDNTASLHSCGLTPNAALHIRLRKT
ncbi:UBXN11 [Branchiostoma lanceolatum]|uniref:UBX domain-containing protein 11 n=1 Tax=Branchiostoma lanceolatum TaxID=7740 RepID=A0A8J9V8W6_BRALA|nr:UBXN11 [Branchiostoma lanceolatum]